MLSDVGTILPEINAVFINANFASTYAQGTFFKSPFKKLQSKAQFYGKVS